jgi:hypothetical protein
MFDFETMNKAATENATKINTAAVDFTRSLVEAAQKNYAAALDSVNAAPATTLYRDWMELAQDSTKGFVNVLTAKKSK